MQSFSSWVSRIGVCEIDMIRPLECLDSNLFFNCLFGLCGILTRRKLRQEQAILHLASIFLPFFLPFLIYLSFTQRLSHTLTPLLCILSSLREELWAIFYFRYFSETITKKTNQSPILARHPTATSCCRGQGRGVLFSPLRHQLQTTGNGAKSKKKKNG